MTTDVRVQCINKTDRTHHYERIQNIGGVNDDGTRWKMRETEAIAGMTAKTYTFYTKMHNIRANVRIGWHQLKHEYLTTDPDGYQPNNLLSLGECP